MENPTRMPVILFSSILFMVAAVMFGEASQTKKNEQSKAPEIEKSADAAPVPAKEQ